jgi:hypothetical protein
MDEPHAFEAADVDGDDHLDIVVATFTGKIYILLNKGDGTFADPIIHPTDFSLFAMTLGDVNGDKQTDIIVAGGIDEGIWILFNSGNGAFTALANYQIPGYAIAVATADMNGDDQLDIILLQYTGIHIMLSYCPDL